MKIVRRSSGGRGEYELSNRDAVSGLVPNDVVDREVRLHLAGGLTLRTGTEVRHSDGKHRFRLLDTVESTGGRMHIHRQVAALLLLPEPVREDDDLGTGVPVLAAKYVLDTVEVTCAGLETAYVDLRAATVQIRNADTTIAIEFDSRLRRVRALWANTRRFSPAIKGALERHRDAVLSGRALGEDASNAVSDLIAATGLSDPAEALDYLDPTYISALCAKPLLILTGPTGTGKSMSAIDLAKWMDYGEGLPPHHRGSIDRASTALALVPVGADWTDQRNILGFKNPFGPERRRPDGTNTNLTYEVTPALRLLLRASHPDHIDDPHFLTLDEMNLSHVERYFSTFLSTIEADRASGSAGDFELVTRDDVALIAEVLAGRADSPLEAEAANLLVSNGRGLAFPPNVFIIGTVNVDETTYMFSPKVLDRAFVAELESVDPAAVLAGTGAQPPRAPGAVIQKALIDAVERRRNGTRVARTAADLKRAALDAGLDDASAEVVVQAVSNALSGVHDLLTPVGFGFGFRVINEVLEYLVLELDLCKPLGRDPEEWHQMLDAALLMKLLPKIHGTRRRLQGSIAALAAFFGGAETQGTTYTLGSDATISIEPSKQLPRALPRSQMKAVELHRTLQATGYTTFIS